MYDVERVGKIITDIQKYIKELDSYQIKEAEDLNDSKNYYATSMIAFAVLNRVIDLGSEIISAENLGAPNTYKDIMPALAKANVINKEQAAQLGSMIGKRNVLAHLYEDINEKDLFKIVKEINLIEKFIATVKKRIATHEEKDKD